jgi:hypothetical protein
VLKHRRNRLVGALVETKHDRIKALDRRGCGFREQKALSAKDLTGVRQP